MTMSWTARHFKAMWPVYGVWSFGILAGSHQGTTGIVCVLVAVVFLNIAERRMRV